MAHARKLIRDKVVELLSTATGSPAAYPTDAEDRVYPSRVRAVWNEELPCILLYTRSENVEVYNQSPIEYRREVELQIEVCARADDQLDDTLDSIAAQVERVLILNETLKPDGWTFDEWPEIRLADTSVTLKGDNGEMLYGAAIISFVVKYYQLAPEDITDSAEGLALDIKPLETAGIDWNLENAQPDDDVTSDEGIFLQSEYTLGDDGLGYTYSERHGIPLTDGVVTINVPLWHITGTTAAFSVGPSVIGGTNQVEVEVFIAGVSQGSVTLTLNQDDMTTDAGNELPGIYDGSPVDLEDVVLVISSDDLSAINVKLTGGV